MTAFILLEVLRFLLLLYILAAIVHLTWRLIRFRDIKKYDPKLIEYQETINQTWEEMKAVHLAGKDTDEYLTNRYRVVVRAALDAALREMYLEYFEW